MNAASELKIKSLLDLASTKVASILKNRGIEDIRSMFKSGCDLSQDELKKYEELQLWIKYQNIIVIHYISINYIY